MKYLLLCCCLCAHSLQVQGQFSDDFQDGNFSQQPTWQGDSAHFIINTNLQLQLNAPAGSTRSVLATRSQAIHEASWEWWMMLDFNPSSANYADVYLLSNRPELDSALQGYFVRIGNTTDEVSLYRQSGQTRTKIIDGADGLVDKSSSQLRIRVTRDRFGLWELLTDTTGSGLQFQSEGAVSDLAIHSGQWFGLRLVYTASRSSHFSFDNFEINGSIAPDTLLPEIVSTKISNRQSITLTFNKPLPAAEKSRLSAFSLEGSGSPFRSSIISNREVLLEWLFPFESPSWLNLSIQLRDSANHLLDTSVSLFYRQFEPGLLIINELLADPTPVVGLPETEMVELHNVTTTPLFLSGWTLEDPQTQGKLPDVLVQPLSHLILSPPGACSLWTEYGNCIEVSPWPSLNNDRDQLWLKNETGECSDSMRYERQWLGNSSRQEGGWTLERINPQNSCQDPSNWRGSEAVIGGTPGSQNSVFGRDIHLIQPAVTLCTWEKDTLLVYFSTAVRGGKVLFNNQIFESASPSFSNIHQFVASYPTEASVISITDWNDCHGQVLPKQDWRFHPTGELQNQAIQFSEIYFRPSNVGTPYVELVNTTNHSIALHDLWLTAVDQQNLPIQSARLGTKGDYILPLQQLVFTRDTTALQLDFKHISPQNRRLISNLPSIYTAGGRLTLNAISSEIISSTTYHDSMHHSQLVDKRGMALEKPQGYWQHHWGSPVFSQRGSPGSQNTRQAAVANHQDIWQINTEIFSPRRYEQLQIHLNGQSGTWVAVNVFDLNGRIMREIFPYQSLEGMEILEWDGTDSNGNLLPSGAYLLTLQFTSLKGESGRNTKRIVIDNLRP